MKNRIKKIVARTMADVAAVAKDNSGASSIVDIIIGLLVAAGIGAIVILAVNNWAPGFFQNVLDSITSQLGF